VIEFQKRGLPHAHILLILKSEDKPKDAVAINKVISSEISNIQSHRRLHAIVTKHMVHGPCGEHNLKSRMIDGKCSKNFPNAFQNQTVSNCDGYPKYQRQNNGRTAIVYGKMVDHSWIVPYNPYFSLKYNCYINVESCASIQSVKYSFKYVYKGHDCANIIISEHGTVNRDEIQIFLDMSVHQKLLGEYLDSISTNNHIPLFVFLSTFQVNKLWFSQKTKWKKKQMKLQIKIQC